MENYITWSDLIQLTIAVSNSAMFIVALITLIYTVFHNRKK